MKFPSKLETKLSRPGALASHGSPAAGAARRPGVTVTVTPVGSPGHVTSLVYEVLQVTHYARRRPPPGRALKPPGPASRSDGGPRRRRAGPGASDVTSTQARLGRTEAGSRGRIVQTRSIVPSLQVTGLYGKRADRRADLKGPKRFPPRLIIVTESLASMAIYRVRKRNVCR